MKLMKIHKRVRPPETNAMRARGKRLDFCQCKKAMGSDPEQSGSQNLLKGAESLQRFEKIYQNIKRSEQTTAKKGTI